MKIAIASSGLGLVQRGIEAWAKSLAEGLYKEKANVVLYHGGGTYLCAHKKLKYRNRCYPLYRFLEKYAPSFTWRWGWKSTYVMEQKSFACALIRELKKNPADIVHTQDVYVAQILTEARQEGIIKSKAILAHGTDEKPNAIGRIKYIQHLTPFYKEKAERFLGNNGQKHFFIPNFVDTRKFLRFSDKDRMELRYKNNIAEGYFVIGTVGAIKSSHKRVDTVIRECSLFAKRWGEIYLLIAGAETDETDAIKVLADQLLKGKYKLMLNKKFEEMPSFYNMLDIYVHPAAEEFFGIAIIEAMACGVPVVVNNTPVLRWITGSGGWSTDVTKEGFLDKILSEVRMRLKETGVNARKYVEENFSWQVVYPMFMKMYEEVVGRV